MTLITSEPFCDRAHGETGGPPAAVDKDDQSSTFFEEFSSELLIFGAESGILITEG